MPDAQKEMILVIEDDPFTRDLLQEELQELGYQTTFLENGKAALATAQNLQPHLILLDVMMPHVDGFTVCRSLRENPSTVQIPIIFITAKNTHQDLIRGLKLGANDYVTKPFNIEILAARIETQLRTKRLIDQVNEQRAEMEKLNITIKEFLGMASHDLRTPASVIKLLVSTLQEEAVGPLNEAQKSFLNKLYQQTTYMNKLLDDLLSISHIESGKIVLNIQPEDIQPLLKENLSALTYLAKNKSIDIVLEENAALPPIPLDKARFTEIVDNIISNAIKFTPEKGKITVRPFLFTDTDHKTWACIAIRDTGVGMDSTDVGHLFQEYVSGKSKPTKGEKSTGLGLSIAKKLTELHHGKLEVSSQVGVGTEFVIKLPLTQS